MIKLFFKHVFRSLFVSVIAALVASVITMIIVLGGDLLFNDMLKLFKVLTMKTFVITTLVVGLIVSVIAVGVMAISSWCGFEEDEYLVNSTPHFAGIFFYMLFIFLLLGGGCTVFIWLKWELLLSLPEKNGWFYLLLPALPTICICEFVYFLGALIYYGTSNMCSDCKHCFCISEKRTSEKKWETYGYEEKTSRENIGSIGKIDVYANVTRGRTTTTHHTQAHYNCNCSVCGSRWQSEKHFDYTD